MLGTTFSSSSPLPNGVWTEKPVLTIIEVLKKSPAEKSGINIGDKIISYSESTDLSVSTNSTPEQFQNFIATHGTHPVSILVDRGGSKKTITMTPVVGVTGNKPAIGIGMDMVGTMRLPFTLAVVEGAKFTALYTSETFKGIMGLLSASVRGKANMSEVSGPVGIVKIVGEASKLGFERLLTLTAIISINLAVVNILPIPALDGGRVFFVLIEAVKRSPIKPKFANAVNTIGFFVLIALIFIITFSDIWKIIVG